MRHDFFFHPRVQPPTASCICLMPPALDGQGLFTLGLDAVSPFPMLSSDYQSCCNQELVVLLSPCAGLEHLYQVTNDCWKKEALPSQLAALASIPCPSFSSRIQDTGCLSQAGDFTSALLLSKTATPAGLCTTSPEAVQTEFSAHRKLVRLTYCLPRTTSSSFSHAQRSFSHPCCRRMSLLFGPQCSCCSQARLWCFIPWLWIDQSQPASCKQGKVGDHFVSYSFSSPC